MYDCSYSIECVISVRLKETYEFIFEKFHLFQGYFNVENGVGRDFRVFQQRRIRIDGRVVEDSTARIDPLGPDVSESIPGTRASCSSYSTDNN